MRQRCLWALRQRCLWALMSCTLAGLCGCHVSHGLPSDAAPDTDAGCAAPPAAPRTCDPPGGAADEYALVETPHSGHEGGLLFWRLGFGCIPVVAHPVYEPRREEIEAAVLSWTSAGCSPICNAIMFAEPPPTSLESDGLCDRMLALDDPSTTSDLATVAWFGGELIAVRVGSIADLGSALAIAHSVAPADGESALPTAQQRVAMCRIYGPESWCERR
jgi:hypothetical protein